LRPEDRRIQAFLGISFHCKKLLAETLQAKSVGIVLPGMALMIVLDETHALTAHS